VVLVGVSLDVVRHCLGPHFHYDVVESSDDALGDDAAVETNFVLNGTNGYFDALAGDTAVVDVQVRVVR
jgi:hypothetical protein